MVKKSLLSRLFNRSESNGPNRMDRLKGTRPERVAVRPEPPRRPANGNGSNELARTSPDGPPSAHREELKPAEGPPVKASEMSRQEELNLKLKEGFRGISSVLTGIDRKIDRHQETSAELMVQVRKIPDLIKDVPDESKAGLELLATISTILESQGRATSELLARMGDLPQAMEELEARFQSQSEQLSQAGQEARDAARQTQEQVGQAFSEVRSRVDLLQTESTRTQERLMRELRRQQSDSDRRIEELIQRSGTTTKVVVFLLVVVIAALLLVVKQFGA